MVSANVEAELNWKLAVDFSHTYYQRPIRIVKKYTFFIVLYNSVETSRKSCKVAGKANSS